MYRMGVIPFQPVVTPVLTTLYTSSGESWRYDASHCRVGLEKGPLQIGQPKLIGPQFLGIDLTRGLLVAAG